MKYLAVAALFLTVVTIPVVGGVLFAFLFFGVFLLALVGVLAGLEDRTVRQHNPSMNPTRWRDGS
jgi:acetyl-CoA carboxylase beta subunit